MAGDPASLASVQAAVMKSAAGKAPSANVSTQANAVQQDLAVMADQAKGYTAGVNAGVIQAQDNRAAQGRRLATEKMQADAARARDDQLAQIEAQNAQVAQQSQTQNNEYERLLATKAASEKPVEPDLEAANRVRLHMLANRTPGFQTAFSWLMNQNPENTDDVLAILDNQKRNGEMGGMNREYVRRYAEAQFKALEGKAVNLQALGGPRRSGKAESAKPAAGPRRSKPPATASAGSTDPRKRGGRGGGYSILGFDI